VVPWVGGGDTDIGGCDALHDGSATPTLHFTSAALTTLFTVLLFTIRASHPKRRAMGIYSGDAAVASADDETSSRWLPRFPFYL
jgi:hypothetical protein